MIRCASCRITVAEFDDGPCEACWEENILWIEEEWDF